MKILFSNIIFFLLFFLPGKCNVLVELNVAGKVLDEIFEKSGYPKSKKPKLLISDKMEKVAAYYPALNTIIFEKRAYQVCQSIGKDSLAAVAFLLGHELAHAFQTEIKNKLGATNFLSYDRHYDGGVRVEKTADIQGAFSAYLAGYKALPVLPELFEKLYEAYNLKGKTIQGYPSLAERKATGKEVEKIVINLIDLFENAGYLTTLGEYSLAKDCYEYILKYYQSRQVYNNLGIIYVFNALEFYDSQTDDFLHPFRLDASPFLQSPKTPRGGGGMPTFKRKLRTQFLKRAERNFEAAIQIDSDYELAKTNLMSVYNLLGQQDKAVFYYSNRFKTGHSAAAKMALALSYLTKKSDEASGKKMLREVLESDELILRNQAEFNLAQANYKAVLTGKKMPLLPLPKFAVDFIESIKKGKNVQTELLYLSEETDTYFSKLSEGSTAVFSFEKPEELTKSFKRIKIKKKKLHLFDQNADLKDLYFKNLFPLDTGYYLLDPQKRFLLKIDKKGRLEEVVRIFKN